MYNRAERISPNRRLSHSEEPRTDHLQRVIILKHSDDKHKKEETISLRPSVLHDPMPVSDCRAPDMLVECVAIKLAAQNDSSAGALKGASPCRRCNHAACGAGPAAQPPRSENAFCYSEIERTRRCICVSQFIVLTHNR